MEASTPQPDDHSAANNSGRYLLASTLGALGVVFGDIGTSPLYTIRECFSETNGVALTPDNIFGILSLIFWSLVIVVTVKYLCFVMHADNRGEGGVLSLMALTQSKRKSRSSRGMLVVLLGLFGAALLYGDGILTPAISVLSAVEGLKVATDLFEPFIIPLTVMILCGIFVVQSKGTTKIGRFFGPVILIWFTVMGLLGLRSIIAEPSILAALNPYHAISYFSRYGFYGVPILGAVFLALTGAEALYADMGHFGRRAIRLGWYWVAFPCLTLNYFGQGALLLREPEAIENPFFHLVPSGFIYPMVALAACATITASQAIISGTFSLTRQAVQLGYLPRLEIRHTSSDEIGQIYVPVVNWALFAATVALVMIFHSSSNLAAAYGIAVSLTMIITTVLLYIVAKDVWKLPIAAALVIIGIFLVIDIAFFFANMLKVLNGGYVPMIIAALVFTLMSTWKKGRELLSNRLRSALITPERFIKEVVPTFPNRLPGTAVFMARTTNLIPAALFHNVKHNQVLHETVVLVSARTEDIPHVPIPGRVEVRDLGSGFFYVVIRYGFIDTPNVPEALRRCGELGLKIDPLNVTYFLSRETLIATPVPGMVMWRERLFALMTRNAFRAATYFKIPSHQVVEIGIEIEI